MHYYIYMCTLLVFLQAVKHFEHLKALYKFSDIIILKGQITHRELVKHGELTFSLTKIQEWSSAGIVNTSECVSTNYGDLIC